MSDFFRAYPEPSITKTTLRVLIICGFVTGAMAQQFPLWVHLLSHYGGKTDETPVPSMKMGNHMQMSWKGPPQPGDAQRAQLIVAAARDVLARYAQVNAAVRDGYRPFYPTGRMGEEVHYTAFKPRTPASLRTVCGFPWSSAG